MPRPEKSILSRSGIALKGRGKIPRGDMDLTVRFMS